jgi:transposase
MGERKPYLSDLSDEQWALIVPVIAAWKQRHPSVSGHQGRYPMREIVNAILYQARTGCQWRYLPHDLPPHTAVYYYFAAWRDDGTDQTIHDLLRCQVRERAGRSEDPSAVVLDTQTVRASLSAPASTTGLDAGKKDRGRKRGLAVDVLGLVIAVVVTAASVHDNAIGIGLLDKVAIDNPSVTTAWVDAGFKNAVAAHGAGLGIQVAVVHRDPGIRGFTPLPKRWVVERADGTLMLHRRLVRDYERRPASSESMLYWSMTGLMTRRLTGNATPSWRAGPRQGLAA